MDSGAPRNSPVSSAPPVPAPAADPVPPIEWKSVRTVGFLGLGLIAVAAVIGAAATAIDGSLTPTPHWRGHTPRLLLVLVGALLTGAAVSMRPDLWKTWAFGAGGAVLAVFGTPAHWDSFRLLFGALGGVALVWAVLLAGPSKYRLPVLSVLLIFHFSGIFFATTTPPSTPWVTEQVFVRIYNPYLQFVYLRNAYHFYSPEPGPASLLVFLLKTETGTDAKGVKQYKTRWVVMPRRPADVRDPLGLTYYRRLSITEQVARTVPYGLTMHPYERVDLLTRRKGVPIPLPRTDEELIVQYRLPQPEVARFVIPSYASHVILENTTPEEAKRTTVKMYRLEHSTMAVEEFINWRKNPDLNTNPYHPSTYRPFFLGEFNALGDMLNPQEPMLYWLVPIANRPGGVPPGAPHRRPYIDFLSIHALDPLNLSIDEVDDPRFKDRVFDWSQLR